MSTERIASLDNLSYGNSARSQVLRTVNIRASFIENRQFRFTDLLEIPTTAGYQLVYRVNSGSMFNLLSRIINIYVGGLSYSVYPASSEDTFTGTLTNISNQIYNINPNIVIPGKTTIASTSQEILKAEGVNILVPAGDLITTDMVLAGANTQQSQGNVNLDDVVLGYADNMSLWLVFEMLENVNTTTKGVFKLLYEEF